MLSGGFSEPGGVVGVIAAELRTRIVSGALQPGAQLSQLALASEFGVSRVPVRDALQWLGAIGLVRSNGRVGATVAPMSIPDLDEIFELRLALEPQIVRSAVPNLRRADLLRVANEMAAMEGAQAPGDWIQHNTEFHSVLYRPAARPRMLSIIDTLRVLMGRYFAFSMPATGTETSNQEHAAIYEAACRGDADGAARLIGEHLVGSYEKLMGQLLEGGFHELPTSGQIDVVSYS